MIGKSLYLGEQVDLSAVDPEKDSPAFSKWSADPAFFRMMDEGFFRQIPVHELKKKLEEKLKKADEKHDNYYFSLRKHDGDDLVGYAAFIWLRPSHQVAALQFYIADVDNWQTLGQEAIQMVLRFGFMELSLNRIELFLPANQEHLINLIEKNGFLREIQMREASFHEGKFVDRLVYGLLKPEYKKSLTEVLHG
jgi:RimJ/RimL family protein N-acetyltransferase